MFNVGGVGLTSHDFFISPKSLQQKIESRGAFEGGASQAQKRFVSRGRGCTPRVAPG